MQPGATTIPCPHCGAKLPVGTRFCGDCGKAIAPARRSPLPDDITVVDSPAEAPPSQPGNKRLPRPDDITVVDPPVEAPSVQPRRLPRPDDITVVDPSGNLPAAWQGSSATPGSPIRGAVPGQPATPGGWSLPAAGSASLPPRQYGAPAAGNPPFSAAQPVAAPLSSPPTLGRGQSAAPSPPQFPVTSGKFPLKKRTLLSTKGGKIGLVVLVLLIVAGGVSIFFIVQSITRHGLPNDIPLPNGANYVSMVMQLPGDPADEAWFYTVSDMQPSQVMEFYRTQLPSNGWEKIIQPLGGSLGTQQSLEIFACKGNKAVQIDANQMSLGGVSAPSGGVAMEIILRPATEMQYCL